MAALYCQGELQKVHFIRIFNVFITKITESKIKQTELEREESHQRIGAGLHFHHTVTSRRKSKKA